ncbi:hypothetical protein SEMRO_85_G045350.1 [Seminavis robusta]|uniref:Uncharacterized protein n=1 Tax=Seminavis robusta TaxID=568900 RepID=A0A9N8DD95_9STRA|nr:hypothetical protein SEMRO_85_G045350.1 [Seminavis robusta]|eukprot:Sro85_g045350.1 n/a (242) ;mRNA; f:60363-61088
MAAQPEYFKASFTIMAGEAAAPVHADALVEMGAGIKGKVAEAVNEGHDIATVLFVNPNRFIPTQGFHYLDDIEATIIHSSSSLLVLRSDQGDRIVSVHFAGGSNPFRVRHAVDADANAFNTESDGEATKGEDAQEENDTSRDMLQTSTEEEDPTEEEEEEASDDVPPPPPKHIAPSRRRGASSARRRGALDSDEEEEVRIPVSRPVSRRRNRRNRNQSNNTGWDSFEGAVDTPDLSQLHLH